MIAEHFHPVIYTDAQFPSATALDVTLRDGSFSVAFQWSKESIRRIVAALARVGVPLIELGYFGGVPELHNAEHMGLTTDFPLTFVEELAAVHPSARFALMIHPGSVKTLPNFLRLKQAGVAMVRFVYHPDWEQSLRRYLAEAQQTGLMTSVNLALSSRYDRQTLLRTCQEVSKWSPSLIYLADTCAAFYPYQVAQIFADLSVAIPVPLGFHAHDFLSLAFANSLAAASSGARYIDISLGGIGRGAGNLRAETWCTSSITQGVASYHLEALLSGLEVLREYGQAKPTPQDLMSIVCGACNLTPPEEQLLRDFANAHKYHADIVACRYAQHQRHMPILTHNALQQMFAQPAYTQQLEVTL